MYIYICKYIYAYMCMCMSIRIRIYMYIYIYICIYMYIYIFTHTHINTDTGLTKRMLGMSTADIDEMPPEQGQIGFFSHTDLQHHIWDMTYRYPIGNKYFHSSCESRRWFNAAQTRPNMFLFPYTKQFHHNHPIGHLSHINIPNFIWEMTYTYLIAYSWF